MLCQNVCVVPLGIMATVSVEEDEGVWLPPLLHAPTANAAQAVAKIPIAKTSFVRCCISTFPFAFDLLPFPFTRREGARIAAPSLRGLNPVHFAVVRQWPCGRSQRS